MLQKHGVVEAGITDASACALASGQPKKHRRVGERNAEAYDSTSQGMANGSSADAEAYASASRRMAVVHWRTLTPFCVHGGTDARG